MRFSQFKTHIFQPTDIAGLVLFRITFGVILLWETMRYFYYGWIRTYWIRPNFYFPYEGFEWLTPWEGNGMYIHFFVLGVLAIFIALGLFYRISISLFFLGFTYVFLLDQSNYLNHFYLVCLLSFMMIWLPANRSFSIDAKLFPDIQNDWVPNWTIWWLRLQLGIVYFFGGIAKINTDWLQGEPMRKWLLRRMDFPIIGQYFDQDWMVYFFSYGGLLLDLFIFPLLIFKRTRWFGVVAISSFHLINAEMFQIGIFPWFMLLATAIFFPPEQLRFWKRNKTKPEKPFKYSKIVVWLVGAYLIIQVLLPLRHHLFDGNVNWTEEGHRFAWHMKLRDKVANKKFYVINLDTRDTTTVRLKDHLSKRQRRKMGTRPIMILQFARYLAELEREEGHSNIAVKAEIKASLNSRPKALFIDPDVDLSKVEYPFYKKADWIMPLKEPLVKTDQSITDD